MAQADEDGDQPLHPAEALHLEDAAQEKHDDDLAGARREAGAGRWLEAAVCLLLVPG